MNSDIRPTPRQMIALSCPAFEMLYGGQKGGGKTYFMLMAAIPLLEAARRRFEQTHTEQAKARTVFFRKNLDDLADMVVKSKDIYPRLGGVYNKVDKKWVFPSGATVEMEHLDGPDDHEGWHGQEIILLGIDQVEQIREEVYTFLMANVRTGDDYYKPYLAARATANPGGRYAKWVKDRFIDVCPPDEIIEQAIELSDGRQEVVTRAFIPAALKDNPYLNADGKYEARLRSSLSAHKIKQYLEGDWSVCEGSFFSSFDPSIHTCESFQIPASWEVRLGLDWGSRAPAATVFVARDADGRLFVIDEYYRPGENGRLYGKRLAQYVQARQMPSAKSPPWSKERQWTVDDFWGVIDSQALSTSGMEGASAGDLIASAGFRLFPAQKDRVVGISQIQERLALWEDGRPGLIIFRDRCPNLVNALSSVRINPHDDEDYDERDNPHAIDALRFVCMEWPVDLYTKSAPERELDAWERMLSRKKPVGDDNRVYTGYGD